MFILEKMPSIFGKELECGICSINMQSVILNFNWIVTIFMATFFRVNAQAKKRFVLLRSTLTGTNLMRRFFILSVLSFRVLPKTQHQFLSLSISTSSNQSQGRERGKNYIKNITAGHYSPISC